MMTYRLCGTSGAIASPAVVRNISASTLMPMISRTVATPRSTGAPVARWTK